MRDKLLTLLKRHEGLRLRPYVDTVGKTTIGYGRNLDDNGVSIAEAELMLRNDTERTIKDCQVQFPWFRGLSDNRQAVVADMVFNMGLGKFMSFRKTIWYIRERDYRKAADEMLDSRWARQVKGRADELAQIMREG